MDSYLITVYVIAAAFVVVFWKAAQWIQASARTAREAESLTPRDLDALKEACEALVADLRAAADEATAAVEASIRKAELVASKLEEALPPIRIVQVDESDSDTADVETREVIAPGERLHSSASEVEALAETFNRIYAMADQGHSAADIARTENRSPGEIKMLLELRELRTRRQAA